MIDQTFLDLTLNQIQGKVVPPDAYELYIRTAKGLVGPIAWTVQGLSDFTTATQIEGKTATIVVKNSAVTEFSAQSARRK